MPFIIFREEKSQLCTFNYKRWKINHHNIITKKRASLNPATVASIAFNHQFDNDLELWIKNYILEENRRRRDGDALRE